MFKFNFDTSKPEDDATVAPEPQNVEELAPSQEVTPTDEVSTAPANFWYPLRLIPSSTPVHSLAACNGTP